MAVLKDFLIILICRFPDFLSTFPFIHYVSIIYTRYGVALCAPVLMRVKWPCPDAMWTMLTLTQKTLFLPVDVDITVLLCGWFPPPPLYLLLCSSPLYLLRCIPFISSSDSRSFSIVPHFYRSHFSSFQVVSLHFVNSNGVPFHANIQSSLQSHIHNK